MVHTFIYKHNGKPLYFLWDVESGSLFNVDDVAFLCALNRYGEPDEAGRAAYEALDGERVAECEAEFDELEREGALNAPQKIREFKKNAGVVKALCLHICHDCNLRCEYCFASGGTYNTARDYMSAETAKASIDFLIASSGNIRNLEVDFFGGEPLMNLDVVKETVEYAKARAAETDKRFSFTMTTNCLLLNKANAEWLNAEMDNVVLSIDGRESVHNGVRKSVSGKDCFGVILDNAIAFRKIRGDKKYYVRGTYTAKNKDFCADVLALNDRGFDQISVEPVVLPDDHPLALKMSDLEELEAEYDKLGEAYIERRKTGKWFNFFHFMIDLEHGPCLNKRLTGCGAGTDYLAVSPTGDIYPCHQFVGGDDAYLLGNVRDGVLRRDVRERFAGYTVLSKPHCAECPAKYYCGGGCTANALHFTGSPDGCYELGCALQRKRLEVSLAIWFIENVTGNNAD